MRLEAIFFYHSSVIFGSGICKYPQAVISFSVTGRIMVKPSFALIHLIQPYDALLKYPPSSYPGIQSARRLFVTSTLECVGHVRNLATSGSDAQLAYISSASSNLNLRSINLSVSILYVPALFIFSPLWTPTSLYNAFLIYRGSYSAYPCFG